MRDGQDSTKSNLVLFIGTHKHGHATEQEETEKTMSALNSNTDPVIRCFLRRTPALFF